MSIGIQLICTEIISGSLTNSFWNLPASEGQYCTSEIYPLIFIIQYFVCFTFIVFQYRRNSIVDYSVNLLAAKLKMNSPG